MRTGIVSLVPTTWKRWKRARNKPPSSVAQTMPPEVLESDPEPSRQLMLDVCMQERAHQTTAIAGLNAFAAALLGFDSVLGVVGLKVDACPNWKGAALASLAVSILWVLLSLFDFVVASEALDFEPPTAWRKLLPRRPWSISPEGLTRHFGDPVAEGQRIVFTLAARIYMHGKDYVIAPKKRCLTAAVAFLLGALILGAIGVAVKAARG